MADNQLNYQIELKNIYSLYFHICSSQLGKFEDGLRFDKKMYLYVSQKASYFLYELIYDFKKIRGH